MLKIKTVVKKIWVFVVAVAIIAASGTTMAFALNNSVTESALANIAPYIPAVKENTQAKVSKAEITAEYTVIDRSKLKPGIGLKDELKLKAGMTTEKVEEAYETILANMVPGEKDMSAEQAAAYAADILKKAYGVDLKGYTAEASFSRSPVPNSDNWGIMFRAPQENDKTTRYTVSVDSVKGTMLHAGFFNLDFREENNKDLGNPEWKNKAVQEISKLIPENVSITSSNVVHVMTQTGVTVVCQLSDGSACAVRLSGENKVAVVYIYFPNGYDGSLDYHPVTENGVG